MMHQPQPVRRKINKTPKLKFKKINKNILEWLPQPHFGTAIASVPLSTGLVSSFLKISSPSAPFSSYVVERFDTDNIRLFSGGQCYDQLVSYMYSTLKLLQIYKKKRVSSPNFVIVVGCECN